LGIFDKGPPRIFTGGGKWEGEKTRPKERGGQGRQTFIGQNQKKGIQLGWGSKICWPRIRLVISPKKKEKMPVNRGSRPAKQLPNQGFGKDGKRTGNAYG